MPREKQIMKNVLLGSLLLTVASGAFAFGEPGQWSSGWGQGVSEYTAVVGKQADLYIACSDSMPVSMTLTVDGKRYGSGEAKGFDLIIDAKEIATPYETGSRVGANNFLYAWDLLRKAKQIRARTADGKLVELPVKHAAKALPKTSDKNFPCSVEF